MVRAMSARDADPLGLRATPVGRQFLTTAVPALSLAAIRRAPKAALTLALVFPMAFAALFVLTMLAFA